MNKISLKAVIFIGCSLGFSTQVISAPVFTFSKITAETDITDYGNVLRASNFGTGGTVSVNGMTFDTDLSELSGMTQGGGDFNTEFTSGSSLDTMLSGTQYQTGGSSSLNLTGLSVAEDYVFQMFLSNQVNNTGYNSKVNLQGIDFNLAGQYNGTAHMLEIAFTANSASESVIFGTGSSSQIQRMQFNGFTLQQAAISANVPEPSTVLLLTMGIAGIGFTRKKLKAKN
jgi:hypothetical protein